MQAIRQLREAGQSLWIDSISRPLLDDGTVDRYVRDLSVSGLRIDFGAYERAIRESAAYDESLLFHMRQGKRGEALLVEEALEDLTRAAALLLPLYLASGGQDGWVTLPLPPSAAQQPARALEEALLLRNAAGLPNLLIELPATPQGVRAIEEAVVCGLPVNATLIYSDEQYLAAAEAWMRGIERRIALGRSPDVPALLSVHVVSWDRELDRPVPAGLENRLGVAMGARVYGAWRELRESARGRALEQQGAPLHRLIWVENGAGGPPGPYVGALAAPGTIHCMSDRMLLDFAARGSVARVLDEQLDEAEDVLAAFEAAGGGIDEAAERLQRQAMHTLARAWNDLLACVNEKSAAMRAGESARAHAIVDQNSSSSSSSSA
jgi:transaldolase